MSLPEKVLERANMLLDNETRLIVALQQKLEEETYKANLKQKECDKFLEELIRREDDIEKSRKLIQAEIQNLRNGMTEEFVIDLRQKEKDLEAMLQKVKEVVKSENASEMEKAKIMDQVKTVVKTVRIETEKKLVETRAENLGTPLASGEKVDVGKILVILEKGNLFGLKGIVSQKDKGRGRIVLSVAGMEVKVERHLLGHPHKSGPLSLKPSDIRILNSKGELDENSEEFRNISAKDRRLLKMLQDELVDPDKMFSKPKPTKPVSNKNSSKPVGAKKPDNTLDVRGKTLSEAQKITMEYFETLYNRISDESDRSDPCRELHPDGKVMYVHLGDAGAPGAQYRAWLRSLPLVQRARPADPADGGEAYLVVELNLTSFV